MKTTVFLIIASLAWIAWLASALAVEHHRETLANVTRADFSQCVTVHNGPIRRSDPGRPNFYRRRSDTV